MAELTTSAVEFRLRRDLDGLKVTVKTTPDFERSLKMRARSEVVDHAIRNGDRVRIHHVHDSYPANDTELGCLLLAVGSSGPEPKVFKILTVRSREQLQSCIHEMQEWIDRHVAEYMRTVDIALNVKMRTFTPAPAEDAPVTA